MRIDDINDNADETIKQNQQEYKYTDDDVIDIYYERFCYMLDEDIADKLSFEEWFKTYIKK